MQIFKVFTFGDYLSETCALTSRANVAEKGMITFCLREKALKMLNFDGFLSLKSLLLATFILTFSKLSGTYKVPKCFYFLRNMNSQK